MRKRLTEAYAVSSSKCDATICVTLLHGVSSGGVTFFQLAPPSRVVQINPSSVPAHNVFSDLNEGANAYTTPRCLSALASLLAALPTLAGTPECSRAKSPLIVFHVFPPSIVLKTKFVA